MFLAREAHSIENGMTTHELTEALGGARLDGESENDLATRQKQWLDALKTGATRPRDNPRFADLFVEDNRGSDGASRWKAVRKWHAPRDVCEEYLASHPIPPRGGDPFENSAAPERW